VCGLPFVAEKAFFTKARLVALDPWGDLRRPSVLLEKLFPRTVSDSSSQTPFQLSSSGEKLQSFGTLAETFSVTGWAVIVATPFSDSH
jgi:hypothetical protein